jgi:23S rRNA (adenine1618-N6)-methyltransferase
MTRVQQKNHPKRKTAVQAKKPAALHPRNPHRGRYDFNALSGVWPELSAYLKPNPKGDNTIDFADDKAVMCLNKALLAFYYNVQHWQIPPGYLCPAIPGRADYIHYLADLLGEDNDQQVPQGKDVKVLDIGSGANCIYPLIGSQSYGWQFVTSDIDPVAVEVAKVIIQSNANLKGLIKPLLQPRQEAIFDGIIGPDDRFDLTMCNPPFHASMDEALAANQRKRQNLSKSKGKAATPVNDPKSAATRNFGGQKAELWCPGGEIAFLTAMANQSVSYGHQVGWFSSLVSKGDNIVVLQQILKPLGASDVKVINMTQGQKISRLIAWRFL